MRNYKTIEELKGKTICLIEQNADEVVITTTDGKRLRMYHDQDCCEDVHVEDIQGKLEDVYNTPVVDAEEFIGHDDPKNEHDSVTLTDYKITTTYGSVLIKWIGSSNGYYSESVYIEEL